MRKELFISLIFAVLLIPIKGKAQSDINFTVYGGSTNFWSNTVLQFPASFLSNISTMFINDESYRGGSYRYEIFNIKEGGEKVSSYKGKYFGFKAKDLFSNIQYGLKLGWAPRMSPFGIYVSCAYQFRRFEAEFAEVGYEKYKLHSVRPGVGIRVTPFINLLEDEKWSPIAEIGTSYNYYFSSSAPYENDKDQFNSGMVSTFSLGARNAYTSITAGVEIDHYSLFNKNYSPDGGLSYPYADVKTNHVTIFISFSHEFN